MSIDINGVKLAKTTFLTIDFSKILNKFLKEDGRIPDNKVRFFVSENNDAKIEMSVVRIDQTLPEDEYLKYYEISCEIFKTKKDQAIIELNNNT